MERTDNEWAALGRKLLFHARMQGETNIPSTGLDSDEAFLARMNQWNPNWKQRVNMMPEEWQRVKEATFDKPRIL